MSMWFLASLNAFARWVDHVTFSFDSLLAASWSNGSMIVARLGVAMRRVL